MEVERLRRLQRRLARAERGSNRRAGVKAAIARLEDKAPGRVEKVDPTYTSQTCHACGHVAPENRESQAVFRCVACGHTEDADLDAAKNIADGRSVTARGDRVRSARSAKREPQRARPPQVA